MMRIKELKLIVSVFTVALALSGAWFTAGANAQEVEVEVEVVEVEVVSACTSQEGVPCTQLCGPIITDEFKAGGAQYIEMTQSRQLNLLSGRSVDFSAPCEPGSKAVSGGYSFLPDGSTIDMDEIRMTSQRAQNDPATGNGSYIVSIYREQSGAPDNCINVEVKALCVR